MSPYGENNTFNSYERRSAVQDNDNNNESYSKNVIIMSLAGRRLKLNERQKRRLLGESL